MNSDTCRKPPLGIPNLINSGAQKRTEAYCFTPFICLLRMSGSLTTSVASYQRSLAKGDWATHSLGSWESKGSYKLLAPLKHVSVILSSRSVFRDKGITRATEGEGQGHGRASNNMVPKLPSIRPFFFDFSLCVPFSRLIFTIWQILISTEKLI